MWTKIKSKFSGNYVRNVLVLAGGSAFAQLIAVLALPILTRLYSPSDFSVLALYISMLSVVSVIACLRFELAIALPESDNEALRLVLLSFISTLFVTAITILGLLLFPELVSDKLLVTERTIFIWLLPVSVFFSGLYSSALYWNTRAKQFSTVSKTKMIQATGGVSIQLGSGLLGWTPIGLLLGHLFISGAGGIGLWSKIFSKNRKSITSTKAEELADTFVTYRRFPGYSTIEAIANAASIQIPVILIASNSIDEKAGLLLLAMRALQAPMGLIGAAVAQVYLSQAAEHSRAGTLPTLTKNTIRGLLRVGILPLLLAAIVAPFVFGPIFGAEWSQSGIYVSWIAPWILIQFISSPISMVMHVQGRQGGMMLLMSFGAFFRIGCVMLAMKVIPNHVVETYAVSGMLFYLLCFFVYTHFSGVKIKSVLF